MFRLQADGNWGSNNDHVILVMEVIMNWRIGSTLPTTWRPKARRCGGLEELERDRANKVASLSGAPEGVVELRSALQLMLRKLGNRLHAYIVPSYELLSGR